MDIMIYVKFLIRQFTCTFGNIWGSLKMFSIPVLYNILVCGYRFSLKDNVIDFSVILF